MITRADKLLIVVLCILAFGGIAYELLFMGSDKSQLEIIVAGRAEQISLHEDRVLSVIGEHEVVNIEIKQGRVRVFDAACPDATCERTGWIYKAPQKIVCVPNKVVIGIVADTAAVDAIIR